MMGIFSKALDGVLAKRDREVRESRWGQGMLKFIDSSGFNDGSIGSESLAREIFLELVQISQVHSLAYEADRFVEQTAGSEYSNALNAAWYIAIGNDHESLLAWSKDGSSGVQVLSDDAMSLFPKFVKSRQKAASLKEVNLRRAQIALAMNIVASAAKRRGLI